MEEKDIEQAEAHLRKAETDLKAAEAAEEAAEHEIKEALQELKEAEDHHHEIHFTVDGEPCETKRHEMTPDEIIREYGGKDPATNYLVQIKKGGENVSYQGKGGEVIKLHNGMQFQIISTGPTPVSDGPINTGVEVFTQGLVALGYSPVPLSGKLDHVVIGYEVPTGRFAGEKVRLGFIVPADFPLTAPSGPHISPHIHPINNQNIGHPLGGVQHSQIFADSAGGEWQYWSRPFPNWGESKKTVGIYMSHIWRLWYLQ